MIEDLLFCTRRDADPVIFAGYEKFLKGLVAGKVDPCDLLTIPYRIVGKVEEYPMQPA
jgi:hypothetical protein